MLIGDTIYLEDPVRFFDFASSLIGRLRQAKRMTTQPGYPLDFPSFATEQFVPARLANNFLVFTSPC
jgi:hypothetical protein